MKKNFLALFIFSQFLTFAQNSPCENNLLLPSYNGSFEYESYTEADGILNGTDYSGATIYYPINQSSLLASIVIVPGFTNVESAMEDWGPFFASFGIVTMTIGTNSIFAQPQERAYALLDAVNSLKQENTRLESPLFNLLDVNNIALGGWSMGGGGALLAAGLDPTIKAIIAFCPWLNLLGGESLNHTNPSLIISGQLDVIAAPAIHANQHYDMIPNETDKIKFEVGLGTHTLATSPLSGNGDVGMLTLAWLKKYLIQDHCFCPILSSTPISASSFLSNLNCEIIFGCTDSLASNFNINATVEDSSCTFNSLCDPILVNLLEGWNMIGFHCSENSNIETILFSIVDQIIIVKNGLGDVYLPDWDFNGIGFMQRGYGYSLKMKTSIEDFNICEY